MKFAIGFWLNILSLKLYQLTGFLNLDGREDQVQYHQHQLLSKVYIYNDLSQT